jgi:two-component system phosphate regulon sensor histidine kinase PhoR
MTSPLFRRLLLGALALLAATLFGVYYVLTAYSARVSGGPPEPRVVFWVLAILMGAAAVASLVGFFVARTLTRRVSRLKRVAESLFGDERPAVFEPKDDLTALERSLDAVAKELRTLVDNLRFESARREAILAGMTEGVLAIDRDLRVTFCNQALVRALGFRGGPVEGLRLVEFVRDPALTDLVRDVLTTGDTAKVRFRLSADTPRIFEVQASPLAMATGRGVLVIFHDTTDLERLEQVRKDFVANVSHELRTPLAGIIGYSDTLLDGALEDAENRRRFVEIIRSNAVRLSNIAADLLVLSELESGTESAEPELISVRAVVDAVLLTVKGESSDRDVKLIREEVQDLAVAGSRLRLEQALLNLLANAIKFNRPGGEVRVRAVLNEEGRVAITIADTGVGIPSEDLPRIFERFYRVDKGRSRQVGGTGLGLSIVKHIVERMSGTISVESQLGKGTTFTILLAPASVTKS